MSRWILILCLAARWVTSEGQVLDDFSDGNLSLDPPWYGDTVNFEVLSQRLWLNAPSQTDTSWLSTLIPAPDSAVWELSLQLDFNPSASNYLRWYLLATEPDLKAAQEGYFLQVGGSSSDRVSLCHYASGSKSVLWESPVDVVDFDTVSLRLQVGYDRGAWLVKRFINGQWNLWGTGVDTLGRPFQNTGLWCRYTSTRSNRFSFDDLYYDYALWVDTLSPRVESYQLIGSNTLKMTFSEVVTADNIRLRSLPSGSWFDAHPDRETGEEFNFNLDQPIAEGVAYRIELAEWSDLSGRTLDTSWVIVYHRPRLRDILITEIMPDPSPAVNLPNEEYIEIYNRSPRVIELERLELWVNDKAVPLAGSRIMPHSFVVLNDIPTLPNSGARIMLKELSGRLIDAVDYSVEDHSLSAKQDGGWSLVLADTARACYGSSVWLSSEDPRGGSPGDWDLTQEMVQPRNRWLSYGWIGDSVELRWLHPLDSAYWAYNPPRILSAQLEISRELKPPFDLERWIFAGEIPAEGITVYWPTGSRDCLGNYSIPDTLTLYKAEQPDSADIRISEILFEPGEDRPEWLEFVNVSERAIDLNDLRIARYDPKFEVIDDVRRPFAESTILNPNDRVVWSRYPERMWDFYSDLDSFGILKVQEWLALPNDSLTLVMLTEGFDPIEVFQYGHDYHLPFMSSSKDVSLERRSFSHMADDKSTWHSGPTALQGATPTRPNSYSFEQSETNGIVYPKVFTPNGDGFNDFTTLSWSFPEPGWWARAQIVDLNGRLVFEHPAEGSTPNRAEWTWWGQRLTGGRSNPGVYFWVLELKNPKGGQEVHRIPVVLSF